MLAVSVDAGDQQRAFAGELGTEFRYLSDTSRNLSVLYGAANGSGELATRQSVLIDRRGIVRWITRNVSVSSHGRDVLAKMRELGMCRE